MCFISLQSITKRAQSRDGKLPLLRDLTWGVLPKEDYTPLQANIKVGLCPGVVVKFHFRVDQKSVEQEWKIAVIVRFE